MDRFEKRLKKPIEIMNIFSGNPTAMKKEFLKLDVLSLQSFKNYLKKDPDNFGGSVLKIVNEVLLDIEATLLKSFKKMNEDDGGGCGYSGGTAMVTQGSTSGLGNVVSAQPGVTPGTTGTTGSGDIGVPFSAIGGARLAQKIPAPGFSNDRRKKRGMSHGPRTGKPLRGGASQVSDLRNLAASKTNKINDMKPRKVMSFDDFSVDKLSKVTHIKENRRGQSLGSLIPKAKSGNVNKLHLDEKEKIMKRVANKLSNFGARALGEEVHAYKDAGTSRLLPPELFTIKFSGNRFLVSIDGEQSDSFTLDSIGNMCKFIKDEIKDIMDHSKEVKESNIYEDNSIEDLLDKEELGLDRTELKMLSHFIAKWESRPGFQVEADEIPIKILNKKKLNEVTKSVNNIIEKLKNSHHVRPILRK